MTVTGIPSMHICLDFVPELLRQPELDKQVRISQVNPTYSRFHVTNDHIVLRIKDQASRSSLIPKINNLIFSVECRGGTML